MRNTWDHCGKRSGLTKNVEWIWMIMLFLFLAIFLVLFGSSLWTPPSDSACPLSFPGTYLLPTLPLQDSSGMFSYKAANAHPHILSLPCSSLAGPPRQTANCWPVRCKCVLGTSGKQRQTPEERLLPIQPFLPLWTLPGEEVMLSAASATLWP